MAEHDVAMTGHDGEGDLRRGRNPAGPQSVLAVSPLPTCIRGSASGKSHPMAIFTRRPLLNSLARITDFQSLLSEVDTYEQTLQKFQAQIDKAEMVRDEGLAQPVFQHRRPMRGRLPSV